jgi:hypothetical protein
MPLEQMGRLEVRSGHGVAGRGRILGQGWVTEQIPRRKTC